MFDKLLEKIKRVDEIESKLLSIFEGKSWEYIAKALYQILDDVSTADDMCKENAKAFRRMVMKLQAKKNQFLYSPDGFTIKSVVEMDEEELQKHGFDVNENGEKFSHVGPISDSIREFFDHKSCGKDGEYLTAFAISRFGFSKLSNVLCNETISDSIWDFLRENPDSTYNEILDGIGATSEDAGKFGNVVKDMLNKSIYVEDGKYHLVESLDENDLLSAVKTLVRNELLNDPDISREELFDNVLNGVSDEVRGEVREILPDVYDGILSRYFESNLKENLTDHARRELELAGMFDKEVDGSEAAGSWNRLCAEAVIELMEVFAEQGHSGFSASMTQDLFSRLSKYEALTELTDNPDEWNDISEMQSGEPGWQSQRNPSCFSEDGGKTYWDISEDYYLREDEEDGMVYSGGLSTEEWKNRPMHQSKHIEKEE